MIDNKYFKEYRNQIGFTNQANFKNFLSAKDIKPLIDYQYIDILNSRLKEIIFKINNIVAKDIQVEDIDEFSHKFITKPFKILKQNNIIRTLNNQGRRPEQVYFSWMRGYIIANYFLKAIAIIFSTSTENIFLIGDDDLTNIDSFKRTPKADIELSFNNKILRIEIQSGFQGINDIKQHKVLEAKNIYSNENIESLLIHFDLFNGQVAFVDLNDIKDNNINWITRQQMEGQTVFNIEQNYFIWKLTQKPIIIKTLKDLIL